MGKTTLIIIAVVIFVGGLFFAGITIQERKAVNAANTSVAPFASGGYYGGSPEWDKFYELQSKGSEGWDGIEQLMASTDSTLAQQAAYHLAQGGLDSIDHFLRGLPSIDLGAKNTIGQDDYSDDVWQRVVEIIENQEEELLEGAAYFLRIEQGDFYRTSLTEGQVGDVLVASIPSATGIYADVLPQTMAFYKPGDLDRLTDLLDSGKEQDRLIAVRALGKLGLSETLPDVRQLKTDSSKEVRSAATTAESSIDAALAATVARASTSSSIMRSGSDPDNKSAKKRLGMP